MIPNIWIKDNHETFKLNTKYFNDMNVIVSLANEYVENSTDQPIVEFYSGNIPEVEFLLAEELKKSPSKFELDTN